MADWFDPYNDWLGLVGPHTKAPNHYQLLGLLEFESDAQTISHAADKQISKVLPHQTGSHSIEAKRLLREIVVARDCLLCPDQKPVYDAHLRRQLSEPRPVARPIPVPKPLSAPTPEAAAAAAPLNPQANDSGGIQISDEPVFSRGRRNTLAPFIGAGVALVGIAVALFLVLGTDLFSGGNDTVADADRQAVADSDSTAADTEDRDSGDVDTETDVDDPSTTTTGETADGTSPDGTTVTGTNLSSGGSSETDGQQPPPQDNGHSTTDVNAGSTTGSQSPVEIDSPVAMPQEPTKLPVPEKKVRDEKRAEIESIFALSTITEANEQVTIARRLLQTARDTQYDPAAEFALYNAARELACAAGDCRLAFEVVEAMDRRFEIDAQAAEIYSLRQAAAAAVPGDDKQGVIRLAIAKIDELLAADEYDKADSLIREMQDVARRIRDREGLAELSERSDFRDQMFEQYELAQASMDTLVDAPDDPQANLAVGTYLAIYKNDWQAGLPLPAKGSDQTLKKLAEMEMAPPASPEAQYELAGAWWDAAEKQTGDLRERYLVRAGQWYRKAASRLSGLSAARAKHRLEELRDQRIDLPPLVEYQPGVTSARGFVGDVPSTTVATGSETQSPTEIAPPPNAPVPPPSADHPPVTFGDASQSVGSLEGTLYVRGDDFAEVRINGEEVAVSREKKVTVVGRVRLGDMITVHGTDKKHSHGFRLLFVSRDGSYAFYTNRGTWKEYQPEDREKWWNMHPSNTDLPAILGTNGGIAMQEAEKYGLESIWGGNTPECYLYHQVDQNDLTRIEEIQYPGIRRRGPAVVGVFHTCGDDLFGLAINGVPSLGGDPNLHTTDMQFQIGDVICVRATNSNHGKGFACVFRGTNTKISFGSNSATWGAYMPPNLQRWWVFDPRQHATEAVGLEWNALRLQRYPDLISAPRPPAQNIWARSSGKNGVAYLFHVVTEDDLAPR